MMIEKLEATHLQRTAVVYVRQSSLAQVSGHLESQRLQYGMATKAQELGFRQVVTIDDDLGRTASGLSVRPGFERLVGLVCAGEVGAVFCVEASRLARNGTDWHHLIEMCALVKAVIVDPDGVYDPRLSNDRLLLGLKGTMSEFELSVLRQRSRAAIWSKAGRGELKFCLPIGLCWTRDGRIELDPDQRVRHAVQLVFDKFTQLGSARQVLMSLREEGLSQPRVKDNKNCRDEREVVWRPPQYHAVISVLRNPFYAGAYAFGRSEYRTHVVNGRGHRTYGYHKPQEEWPVLLRDHHPGYINWEQYERNQRVLAENTNCRRSQSRRSGRGGKGLLAGLLRCARCGHMLHVTYVRGGYNRYECRIVNRSRGAPRCISFGGLRIDQAVSQQLFEVVQPHALDIAWQAHEQARTQHEERVRCLALELEEARYQVQLAMRRYERVDPDNRLVAADLETRWNEALQHAHEVEARVRRVECEVTLEPELSLDRLARLSEDLVTVWNAPGADMRLKQRIVRVLVREIVVDIDEGTAQVILKIHWQGGRHSELRVQRPKPGEHRNVTSEEAEAVVRHMAGTWPDREIAATLNRLGLKTGNSNTWTESRVYSLRKRLRVLDFDPDQAPPSVLTMNQAADRLGVGSWVIRRLIKLNILKAKQVIRSAPWQIELASLESEEVKQAARQIISRRGRPGSEQHHDQNLRIPGT
jgi:DNA invertase Pin-like site-specific DNA recombinase